MKYESEFIVKSFEANLHNRIKPTPLIQYLQETADNQMRDQDVQYTELYLKYRKAFIVSRMSIEIVGSIGIYDKIISKTWTSTGRAANFPRGYEIIKNGQPVIKAMSNWALVDVDTKKLIRYKDYDMSRYPNDEPEELNIPTRFRIPKNIEFHEGYRTSVRYSQIDINKHMNNAFYANILYDTIPDIDQLELTSINLRYVHEAAYGSEIIVYISEAVDPEEMDAAAEKVYYFYTQTNGNTNVEAVFGVKKH